MLKLSPQYTPHWYQDKFLLSALDSIKTQPRDWHLYTSPTGTGKSIMSLMLMSELPNGLLITPRVEIISGMLDKCGFPVDELSESKLIQLAAEHGIFTPIRLRNVLAKGLLPFEPHYLIVDECHHDLAQSYQDIGMYLNGIPKVGLTATGFRGTPKQTQQFHQQWNDTINVVLTVEQAVKYNYCTMPEPTVWNLLDDDDLKIRFGEFDTKQTEDALLNVLTKIVRKASPFYSKTEGKWWRSTMFSVPSVDSARNLKNAFDLEDVPTRVITGDTSYHDRKRIFKECTDCTHALIQINVVSEGVDLPIRRLIDCAPTMSPVKWMQQIGRIMRPTDRPPEYYTICRNLERHCYLMEGMFPTRKIIESQVAFNLDRIKPSDRAATVRVLGTEGLHRFKAIPVKLLNGLTVFMYHLNYQDQFKRNEFLVIVHPNSASTVTGIKQSFKDEEGSFTWGKWKAIEQLPLLEGFTTVKSQTVLHEKQEKWWKKSAKWKGLDPDYQTDVRSFQVLPFLTDLGMKL